MPVATLDSRSLADRAHSELRRLILDGDLMLGAPIAEEALAARLGISRTPVREALRRLAEEGLVEAGGRQRARIAAPTDEDIAGIVAVRAALDALAAATCARRRDPQMLEELHSLAARIDAHLAAGDLGATFAADGDFHRALGRASGNRELDAHLARIDGRVQLVRLSLCRDPAAVGRNTAAHAALLAAIAAGDAEAAATVARDHALGAGP
jgi:DNA-binding GntR family transcriptional regulator